MGAGQASPGGGCNPKTSACRWNHLETHFCISEAQKPAKEWKNHSGRACASHHRKPRGVRFGKKEKISQTCHLGKQLLTTTGPAFLKNQDVGSVPLLRKWGEEAGPGPRAQARGAAPLNRPRPARPILARGQAHTKTRRGQGPGGGVCGSPLCSAEAGDPALLPQGAAGRTFHSGPALRPRLEPGCRGFLCSLLEASL